MSRVKSFLIAAGVAGATALTTSQFYEQKVSDLVADAQKNSTKLQETIQKQNAVIDGMTRDATLLYTGDHVPVSNQYLFRLGSGSDCSSEPGSRENAFGQCVKPSNYVADPFELFRDPETGEVTGGTRNVPERLSSFERIYDSEGSDAKSRNVWGAPPMR